MNYEDLIKLIDHIDQSDLAYVKYETEEQHVVIAKEVPQMAFQPDISPVASQPQPNVQAPEIQVFPEATEAAETATPAEPEETAGEAVVSPMVGVVYLQPGPDQDPYVKVGDRVEQGDVVCIIEAMKLMNEIQAPVSGTVTEILVENEEVVEFNQPLIRIEP